VAPTKFYRRRQSVSKQQENDRAAFGSDALDWWFLVYPTTRSLISQFDGHKLLRRKVLLRIQNN